MEKFFEDSLAFLLALAAVFGGSGGCAVAAHKVLRGRSVSGVLLLAYAFVGIVFAVAGVISLRLFMGWQPTYESAILVCLMFGAGGASALAGANLSVRLILKRFNLEAEFTVRPIDRSK